MSSNIHVPGRDAMGVAITAVENGALEPVERDLVDHVERGEFLDLAHGLPVDEAAMRSRDTSQTIRAWVIRDIARGRLASVPDPRGLRLRGAKISGRLDLDNITTTIPIALHDCLLEDGLIARDATLARLDLKGCWLEHPDKPALDLERVTATVVGLERITAIAHNTCGAVILSGARLGYLWCSAANLHNNSGPALKADTLQVDGIAFLQDGFEAIGTGDLGAVRLLGAHLGQLECDRASLHNASGPALHADNLRIESACFLRGGFRAVGAGMAGAVRLSGAHLGQLDCTRAHLHNDTGPALNAQRMHVDQGALLRDGFEATGGGDGVVVDLRGVQIGGVLVFDPTTLEHRSDPRARVALDGLVYTGLPLGIGPEGWLDLVQEGTPGYAAQPYQQLANAHRAAGHDGQARAVLRRQRRDQIRRKALSGHAERTWARFTGLTLGYGYQPWRALIALLVVVITAAVLAVLLGGEGGLAQVRNPPSLAPLGCTVVERVGVGLDLGTPLITTSARTRCDVTVSSAGQILTVAGWVLRLLAWAFATLFIAGFTGAVRKT